MSNSIAWYFWNIFYSMFCWNISCIQEVLQLSCRNVSSVSAFSLEQILLCNDGWIKSVHRWELNRQRTPEAHTGHTHIYIYIHIIKLRNPMTRDLYGSTVSQTTNTQLLTIWRIVPAVAQCASHPQPHFSIRKGTAAELLRVRRIKVAHGILQSCDPRTDRFQQSWTVGDLFRQCIWKLPGAVDGKTSAAFEYLLYVMVPSDWKSLKVTATETETSWLNQHVKTALSWWPVLCIPEG